MRVLELCHTMYRMGTWYRAFYLSRALARRGHDVTLVKVSAHHRLKWERLEEDGVHLIETPRFIGGRISRNNTRLPSDLIARVLLLARHRFDVVHTCGHHFNTMLPGLVARYLLRQGALVADWDDLWTEGGIYGVAPEHGLLARANYAVDRWSEAQWKRCADAVTVVSYDLRDRAIAHGVVPACITLIPNGAPIDVIRPMPKEPLRRALTLPLDRPVLIFTGYGQFDIDMVLDAVRLLKDWHVAAFTVITGPNEDLVLNAVRVRGLQKEVRVAGVVPYAQLCQYLAASDVGLIPYADKPLNRARWPIKLGDYLAAGLAIATCRVGEMGRVVQEWDVGHASAPDTEAFARGIRALMDDRAFEAVGRRSREAAERLTWDLIAEDLERVFERAVERRHHRDARLGGGRHASERRDTHL